MSGMQSGAAACVAAVVILALGAVSALGANYYLLTSDGTRLVRHAGQTGYEMGLWAEDTQQTFEGLTLDAEGDVLVLSTTGPGSPAIHKYRHSDGAYQGTVATGLTGAHGDLTRSGSYLYFATGTHSIGRYELDQQVYAPAFVSAAPERLTEPGGIAMGPDGNLYVVSYGTYSVVRFNGSGGAYIGVFIAPLGAHQLGPRSDLAFGPDGCLYVGMGDYPGGPAMCLIYRGGVILSSSPAVRFCVAGGRLRRTGFGHASSGTRF